MFTGHIKEIGTVAAIEQGRIAVRVPGVAATAPAAICANGVGLAVAVAEHDNEVLEARLSADTERRSTLGQLQPGARVNVEIPLALGDPIGGHLVQGDVEAIGKVVRIDDERTARRVWIKPPDRFIALLDAKCDIAVDGVSLTIAEVSRDRFAVAAVPWSREPPWRTCRWATGSTWSRT